MANPFSLFNAGFYILCPGFCWDPLFQVSKGWFKSVCLPNHYCGTARYLPLIMLGGIGILNCLFCQLIELPHACLGIALFMIVRLCIVHRAWLDQRLRLYPFVLDSFWWNSLLLKSLKDLDFDKDSYFETGWFGQKVQKHVPCHPTGSSLKRVVEGKRKLAKCWNCRGIADRILFSKHYVIIATAQATEEVNNKVVFIWIWFWFIN